jgi:hypothetical protein
MTSARSLVDSQRAECSQFVLNGSPPWGNAGQRTSIALTLEEESNAAKICCGR